MLEAERINISQTSNVGTLIGADWSRGGEGAGKGRDQPRKEPTTGVIDHSCGKKTTSITTNSTKSEILLFFFLFFLLFFLLFFSFLLREAELGEAGRKFS